MTNKPKHYAAHFPNGTFAFYDSWLVCKKAVIGVSGAKHKSFATRDGAIAWVEDCLGIDISDTAVKPPQEDTRGGFGVTPLKPGQIVDLYVDGAYQHEKCRRAGWGWVAIHDEVKIGEAKGITSTNALSRNIDGELEAAIQAMEWANSNGYGGRIFHDYKGIAEWAEGTWKARSEVAKSYLKRIKPIQKNFSFVKVRGHSGDTWNDYADLLATNAITEFLKGSKNR